MIAVGCLVRQTGAYPLLDEFAVKMTSSLLICKRHAKSPQFDIHVENAAAHTVLNEDAPPMATPDISQDSAVFLARRALKCMTEWVLRSERSQRR